MNWFERQTAIREDNPEHVRSQLEWDGKRPERERFDRKLPLIEKNTGISSAPGAVSRCSVRACLWFDRRKGKGEASFLLSPG